MTFYTFSDESSTRPLEEDGFLLLLHKFTSKECSAGSLMPFLNPFSPSSKHFYHSVPCIAPDICGSPGRETGRIKSKMYFPESEGHCGLVPSIKSVRDLSFRDSWVWAFVSLLSSKSILPVSLGKAWSIYMTLGRAFTSGCSLLYCYSLLFGFWWSSPEVPPSSMSTPAVVTFSLEGVFLGLPTRFC